MNWNLFANGHPTPADFPVMFGAYMNRDSGYDKATWSQHIAEEYTKQQWHSSWTHWISLKPPALPKSTRAELDLEIGTRTARESGFDCISNGNLAKLAAQCVEAGRQDLKKSIEDILIEISVYSKSMYSGPVNYELVVSRISKMIYEGTGNDT